MNGKCPDCGSKVPLFSSVKLGYITTCPTCEVELEVISLKPLELDYPLFDDEFDDDDYDDDWDD
jgi:lysine biosynthesis protein LysW